MKNDDFLNKATVSREGKRIIESNRARVRRRQVKKFFAIVFSMTLCFMLFSAAVMFAYIKLLLTPEEQKNITTLMGNSISNAVEQGFAGFTRSRITVLLIGVDKEGLRTDTIMIATVDKTTNRVDLISVPRDTRVTVPNSLAKKIRASGAKYFPSDNKLKINGINAYCVNMKNSIEILRDYLEDMLNINIDYYAKIETKAFAEAIDILGGIEYDVKDNMYYNDPTQDLLINLKKGKQVLNGKQAEGLVRFRSGYFNADLGRIQVQQDFLKTAFTQIKAKMSVDKMSSLAFKLYKYVETDFKVTGIPEALDIASNLDETAIYSHTIPGTTQTIETGGVPASYFIYDVSGTEELIDSIWYPEVTEEENKEAQEAIKWKEY